MRSVVDLCDGNDNPTRYDGSTISFDQLNCLTSFGTVMTAGYRQDNLRAWKQNSAGRTYFLYDGGFPVCELNSSGAVTAVNTWGAKGVCARHTTLAGSVFYAYDGTGNDAERTNTSGAVVASYSFDAWGNRSVVTSDPTAFSDPYSGFGGMEGYYTDWEDRLRALRLAIL